MATKRKHIFRIYQIKASHTCGVISIRRRLCPASEQKYFMPARFKKHVHNAKIWKPHISDEIKLTISSDMSDKKHTWSSGWEMTAT